MFFWLCIIVNNILLWDQCQEMHSLWAYIYVVDNRNKKKKQTNKLSRSTLRRFKGVCKIFYKHMRASFTASYFQTMIFFLYTNGIVRIQSERRTFTRRYCHNSMTCPWKFALGQGHASTYIHVCSNLSTRSISRKLTSYLYRLVVYS